MEPQKLRLILESALLAYGQPLSLDHLHSIFVDEASTDDDESTQLGDIPSKQEVEEALLELQQHCEGRGFELKKISSGWRFQVRPETARWVNRLWDEKPQRYSRALLETLSIIAYRQPITRGDIEEIRGVAVSSYIIKTLSEREWIKVVGQRDVPGRPSLYATTRQFLDYFNLESLEELPSLRELADIESLTPELDLKGDDNTESGSAEQAGDEQEQASNDERPINDDTVNESSDTAESDMVDENVSQSVEGSVEESSTEENPTEENKQTENSFTDDDASNEVSDLQPIGSP